MKILSLSGFIPEQICDTVRFTQYSGSQAISHYCGYAADYISQVIEDNSVDGAAYPRSCDSSRVIGNYLSDCDKFTFQMKIPARQDEIAVDFFAENIRRYKSSVENYYGISLNDVDERAEKINERNSKIAELYVDILEFSYIDYINNIHYMLGQPLDKQAVFPFAVKKRPHGHKRVYIIGSFLSNIDIIVTMENAGITIAGDNLTESKRLFSAPPVYAKSDIYRSIGESILRNKPSPTLNNFNRILSDDLAEIKAKDIKGVIFVTQKYCESYDYLFASYKRMLDENSVPVLRLVLSDSTDIRKAELAVETFAEII